MKLVVWTGPVAPFQVPGATVPGASEKFITCVGDIQPGKAHCPALADSYMDKDGRRIPGMLRQLGLPDATELYLGAFSAGGSIVKRLLLHPDDRKMVKAVMLADASYSSEGSAKNPAPVEGYVRYARDLLSDPSRMFVATASASPNKNYGSGAQVLDATRRSIGEASFVAGSKAPVGLSPDRSWSSPSGNVIFADYGTQGGGHGLHPKIAPQYWQEILNPFLISGGARGRVSGLSWSFKLLAITAGVAVGYGVIELAKDKR